MHVFMMNKPINSQKGIGIQGYTSYINFDSSQLKSLMTRLYH